MAIDGAETRHQGDAFGKPGDMICNRNRAAGELLFRIVANSKNVALAGLSQGRRVVVLINDRIADHQYLQIGKGCDLVVYLLVRPPAAKSVQKLLGFRRKTLKCSFSRLLELKVISSV